MTSKTNSNNISNSVPIKIISTIAGKIDLSPSYTKIFSFENPKILTRPRLYSQGDNEDDHDSMSI